MHDTQETQLMQIDIVPLHADLGAEIRGVGLIDVAASQQAYEAVRAAFEQYSVLLFRDQQVTDDIQATFSRAFGPLERTKVGTLGEGTFYVRLSNLDAEGRVVADNDRQVQTAKANALWHTDSSFKTTPALASVLSARVLPDGGSQTQFPSTRPEHVYSHAWRAGDVLMWDNRAVVHRGPPSVTARARSMVRTTVSATEADGVSGVRP